MTQSTWVGALRTTFPKVPITTWPAPSDFKGSDVLIIDGLTPPTSQPCWQTPYLRVVVWTGDAAPRRLHRGWVSPAPVQVRHCDTGGVTDAKFSLRAAYPRSCLSDNFVIGPLCTVPMRSLDGLLKPTEFGCRDPPPLPLRLRPSKHSSLARVVLTTALRFTQRAPLSRPSSLRVSSRPLVGAGAALPLASSLTFGTSHRLSDPTGPQIRIENRYFMRSLITLFAS